MALVAFQEPQDEAAELEDRLRHQPSWVQSSINEVLRKEFQRSFQNVAGQVRVFKEIMSDLVKTNQSEDAEALRQLLKDIPAPSVRALEDRADAIARETSELKQLIRDGQFGDLKGRAQRLANQARRFKEKFGQLHRKLARLQAKLEEEAAKLETASKASQDLFTQTELHRDRWLWLLDVLGKGATGVSACLLTGSLGSLGYLYYIYQGKAVALGSAKAAYVAAKKILVEKTATAQSVAAEASAGKAVAAKKAAAVTSANHALQGAEGSGAAATGASTQAGPKAALAVAGASVAGSCWLLHSADVAQAAYQAASAAASAASSTLSAAHVTMAAAAADAAQAEASVNSLQVAMASLSATMGSAVPLAITAGALLALCMIGYAGRDVVKRMLGRLWQEELRQHQEMSELFHSMAQRLRDGLRKLKGLSDSAEKVEDALTLVIEVAEGLAGHAEDCQEAVLEDDVANLHQEVDKLTHALDRALPAVNALQDSLKDVSQIHFIANASQIQFLPNEPRLTKLAEPRCLKNMDDAEGTSLASWEWVDDARPEALNAQSAALIAQQVWQREGGEASLTEPTTTESLQFDGSCISSMASQHCFLMDSIFQTPWGFCGAATLQEGSEVLASSGEVLRVLGQPERHMALASIELQAAHACLRVTSDHRIVVPSGDTVPAMKLDAGSWVLVNGKPARLTAAEWKLERVEVLKITFHPDLPVNVFHKPSECIESKGQKKSKKPQRSGMNRRGKPGKSAEEESIPDTQGYLTD